MNLTCSNISHERFPEYRSDALVWPSHDVTIAISEELFAPQNRHGGVHHIVIDLCLTLPSPSQAPQL